jgi:hypothetical protein
MAKYLQKTFLELGFDLLEMKIYFGGKYYFQAAERSINKAKSHDRKQHYKL